MRRIASAGCLVSLLLMLLLQCRVSGATQVNRILTLPDSPDEMPYQLNCINSQPSRFGLNSYLCADVSGDGISEFLWTFSDPSGEGFFRSSVLVYKDLSGEMWLFQYNGDYKNAKIWSSGCVNIDDVPGSEIVLTKFFRDSVFLEVIHYDGQSQELNTTIVPAGVGERLKPDESWHWLEAKVLCAIDVNDDGVRDLIFSRSAKPDSAFDRGVTAYDLIGKKPLWFYPVSDAIDTASLEIFTSESGEKCIVFTVASSNNAYASNGMDSFHAYLVAIDLDGRELWRQTIGSSGEHPLCARYDIDSDGTDEVCATVQPYIDSIDSLYCVRCYDPFSGELRVESEQLAADAISIYANISDRESDNDVLLLIARKGDSRQFSLLDESLTPTLTLTGPLVGSPLFTDLTKDGFPEIIMSVTDGRTLVLDSRNLEPLAYTQPGGDPQMYYGSTDTLIVVCGRDGSWNAYNFERQPLLVMLYARYKWFLAVLMSAALAILAYRAGRWIYSLYVASAGLPTLQSIKAAVVVLNRNGKISYFNGNPLVTSLFGAGVRRSIHFSKTGVADSQRLLELISKSYEDPYSPVQERCSFEVNGVKLKVDFTIMPRVDSRNRPLGKIIIAEDATGRAGLERKVVFGEAAQRWLHRLKGAMATAKIRIDNTLESPGFGTGAPIVPAFFNNLHAIKKQLDDTAYTADRILSFCAVAKPDLMICDINSVISSAARPLAESPPKGIVVAQSLQNDLPPVLIDPEQIRDVVENLLSNAVNAISDVGTVTVATRLADDLLSEGVGRMVEIVISDTGSGISLDDMPKIFDPGFTRSKNGTGVGLAIVKEMVEDHDGSIQVDSKMGEGSRFTIRIPVRSTSDG